MKQYKFICKIEALIKATNYKTAKEHIKNGFMDEYSIIEIEGDLNVKK